jgi:hypothetical protein
MTASPVGQISFCREYRSGDIAQLPGDYPRERTTSLILAFPLCVATSLLL